jgi:hypothetical protein
MSIDNTEDIIDSRDVIARIEELEGEKAGADTLDMDWGEIDAELATLRKLAEQGEGSPDWPHGEALVRDSHFEAYARQLAEDIDALPPNRSWPLNCIDWEAAAEALQQDYFDVDFDGVTYWVRS